MKRGKPLQRKTRLKSGPAPLSRRLKRELSGQPQFRLVTLAKNGRCAAPGCSSVATDPHHVVYRNKLRRERLPEWDPDNGLPLCRDCHDAHHYAPGKALPLTCLRDENIAFAFAALGAYAYDYLRRRHAGRDPRLESHLAAAAAAAEATD